MLTDRVEEVICLNLSQVVEHSLPSTSLSSKTSAGNIWKWPFKIGGLNLEQIGHKISWFKRLSHSHLECFHGLNHIEVP